MNFLHPEFLYLAPLVAAPILIHLLNRVRYRRVRWAAIEFLLTTERRAVRRARLRQILLMMLRTLLLAAALLALAQPVLRGGIAALLGGASQIAVVVDASGSMSARDSTGTSFDRAGKLVSDTFPSVAGGTRATAGLFAAGFECPFREPVRDLRAVASVIETARITDGHGDVPRAIRSAAGSLRRGGGGGVIWVLTDLQASGWWAERPGAWEQVHQALEQAGHPHVVISDVGSKVDRNLSVAALSVSPSILMKGDRPKLTATVAMSGEGGAVANLALFLDDRRIDSRSVRFTSPGKVDAVFHLPVLERGTHAGYLELSPDALPADDRYYFLIRAADRIPLLVVDGAPSSVPFEGAGDFLALALEPPELHATGRSPFSVKTIPAEELPGANMSDYAAIFLADVARLDPPAVKRLREFVTDGGVVMIFPGEHTDVEAWNNSDFPGVRIESIVRAEDPKSMKIHWISPTSPVTGDLPREGLDRVAIRRLFRFAEDSPAEILATTDANHPFLLRLQMGKGKVYLFAVSPQSDFSNLPLTPVLLLTVHRGLRIHLVETGEPPSRTAFDELRLPIPPGSHHMLTPDNRSLPLSLVQDKPGEAMFSQTAHAGIYRLVQTQKPGTPVAAINVPPAESTLERIDAETIRSLLKGHKVSFLSAEGQGDPLTRTRPARIATSSFPLAALAMSFLLGEVLLGWSISRRQKSRAVDAAAVIQDRPQPLNANMRSDRDQ